MSDPVISAWQREDALRNELRDLNAKCAALSGFVREIACQDPGQPIGQRQSNKERAEDLCEQWGIE